MSKKIKILDINRISIDIFNLSEDELEIHFPDDPSIRQAILDYQYLFDHNPSNSDSDIQEIIIRQLLQSGAIAPVISKTGLIQIRVKNRTEGFFKNHDLYTPIAFAAEESIKLEGFMINNHYQGVSITDLYEKNVFSLLEHSYLGNYITESMSVLLSKTKDYGPIGPFIINNTVPDEKNVITEFGTYVEYSEEAVAKLVSQVKYMLKYHLEHSDAYVHSAVADIVDGPVITSISKSKTFPKDTFNATKDGLINKDLMAIATKLKLNSSNDDTKFKSSLLADLFSTNSLMLYYHQLNKNNDEINHVVNNRRMKAYEQTQVNDLKIKQFKNTAKAQRYLMIIRDKFGKIADVINNKLTKTNQIDEPSAVLDMLPDEKARKLVEKEYINIGLKWKGIIDNKCPHVPLMSKTRHTVSINKQFELLTELKTYFKTGTIIPVDNKKIANDWAECKLCGYHIICPHVVDMITMQYKRVPYEQITTHLQQYAIKISTDNVDNFAYYCKICNEHLTDYYETGRRSDSLRLYDMTPVKRVMWAESFKALSNVIFKSLVDTKNLVKIMVDKCYPIYQKIESNIIKHTKHVENENDISTNMNIYIILIIYAYILNMIRSSYNSTNRETEKLGFQRVSPGAKMSKFAEIIIEHILKNYSKMINSSDLDKDIIVQRFKELYKLVVSDTGNQLLLSENGTLLSLIEE